MTRWQGQIVDPANGADHFQADLIDRPGHEIAMALAGEMIEQHAHQIKLGAKIGKAFHQRPPPTGPDGCNRPPE